MILLAIVAIGLFSGLADAAISNGNFEIGSYDGWVNFGGSNSIYLQSGAASSAEGDYCLRTYSGQNSAHQWQTTTYTSMQGITKISFYGKGYNSVTAYFIRQSDGVQVSYVTATATGNSSNGFAEYVITTSIPQDGNSYLLRFAGFTGGLGRTGYWDDLRLNDVRLGPAPMTGKGVNGFIVNSNNEAVLPYAVYVYDSQNNIMAGGEFSSFGYTLHWRDRVTSETYRVLAGANGFANSEITYSYPADFTNVNASSYRFTNGDYLVMNVPTPTPTPAATVVPSTIPTLQPRPTFSPPTAAPVPTVAPYPTYPSGSINPYEYLDYLAQIVTSLIDWLFSMPAYILGEIRSQLDYVVSSIGDLIRWVGDSLSLLLEWLGSTVTDSINFLLDRLYEYYNGIVEKIDELIEAIKAGVGAPLDDLKELVVYPFRAVINLIIYLAGYTLSPFINLVANIKSIYQLAFDVIIGTLATFLIGSWVTLLGAELAFVIGMRAYYFLLPIVRTVLGWIP